MKQEQKKHGKALLELHQAQVRLEKNQGQTQTDIGHISAAQDALKAGQDDIRDKMSTEGTVMDLGGKVDRITRNHERRIEELETHAGLKNPYRN